MTLAREENEKCLFVYHVIESTKLWGFVFNNQLLDFHDLY